MPLVPLLLEVDALCEGAVTVLGNPILSLSVALGTSICKGF